MYSRFRHRVQPNPTTNAEGRAGASHRQRDNPFPSVPSSRRRFALGTGIVNLEAFACAGRRTTSWSHSDLPDQLQPNRKASFRLAEDHGGRLCGQFNYSQQSNPDTLVRQPCREVTARGRLPLLPPSLRDVRRMWSLGPANRSRWVSSLPSDSCLPTPRPTGLFRNELSLASEEPITLTGVQLLNVTGDMTSEPYLVPVTAQGASVLLLSQRVRDWQWQDATPAVGSALTARLRRWTWYSESARPHGEDRPPSGSITNAAATSTTPSSPTASRSFRRAVLGARSVRSFSRGHGPTQPPAARRLSAGDPSDESGCGCTIFRRPGLYSLTGASAAY